MAYHSIQVYLSAIRFYQINSGLPDPDLHSFSLLSYVLRGIHRLIPSSSRRHRLPLTADIMRLLFETWSHSPVGNRYDTDMLWAACCTGFFGFMRAGEFTCPSWRAFTADMLCHQDVSVDSRDNPSIVSIHLRRSKTDPFGAGVTIHLGRTHQPICPVAALLAYLAQRGCRPGPLFLCQNGSPLSRHRLMRHVRVVLDLHGIDSSNFTGHSFRIGAATTAALAGLEDSSIQALGRWRSAAFLRYIRTPTRVLAASSRQLCPRVHPLPPQ